MTSKIILNSEDKKELFSAVNQIRNFSKVIKLATLGIENIYKELESKGIDIKSVQAVIEDLDSEEEVTND